MSLSQLAGIFLRIGATGFGGPVALVAFMEEEFCARRAILPRAVFNESYVLCKMLPGPVAYQMALSIGYLLRGRLGGLVSGVCFLLPSFLMMLALSVFYTQVQGFAGFKAVAEGLRAGALVVIFDSVLRMAKPHAKDAEAWVFAAIGAVFMWLWPRGEPLIILAGGLAVVFGSRILSKKASLLPLFWVHFKAGAFTFGTGLAIIPLLQHESVEVYRWLTQEQFLDAIAFGQVTPGPITIASVFIGYQVDAWIGAVVAAFGIYLPGALIVLGVLPGLRRRLTGTPFLQKFQRGALPTVIGCILAASLVFGAGVVSKWETALVFLALGVLSYFRRMPSWAVIGLGGLATLLLKQF